MGLPNVQINIERHGLGGVTLTNDRIMGLLLTGVAVVDTLELDKAYAIYSTDQAIALGITVDGENAAAFKQIKAFYDVVGTGAKLWIVVSDQVRTIDEKVDKSVALCPAKILLDAAGGEVSGVGVCWLPGEGYQGIDLDGLDEKVYQAILNADSLALDYVSGIMPVFFVLEGIGFQGDGDSLRDLHTMTSARAAVCLAAMDDTGQGALGMFMGREASNPVHRKPSRVKSGALPIVTGYLTDGANVKDRLSALPTIHDKGFIIFRMFPTRSGYYFNSDNTATSAEDDLHMICNIRVIDKGVKIAYNTFVEEVEDEVSITEDGKLDPATIGYLQGKIDNQVNLNMTGEISGFESYIDPSQNILSSPRLNVVLRITPKGYMTDIIVSLGFKNPALS